MKVVNRMGYVVTAQPQPQPNSTSTSWGRHLKGEKCLKSSKMVKKSVKRNEEKNYPSPPQGSLKKNLEIISK